MSDWYVQMILENRAKDRAKALGKSNIANANTAPAEEDEVRS